MNIGNNIKQIRKKKGITQEQLADVLGISFQAVSKWENGISFPDVTLLPLISSFFETTIDELFCSSTERDEIDEIRKSFWQFFEADPAKAKFVVENGLKKYPENESLLVLYLYVIQGDTDKSIEIAEKILKRTKNAEFRYEALRFLGYSYKQKGDFESAKRAVEQIPEMSFSKLTELAYLSEGEEKFISADKQKWISAGHLFEMMWKITEYYKDLGKISASIEETENALKIIDILKNPLFDNFKEFFEKELFLLKNK